MHSVESILIKKYRLKAIKILTNQYQEQTLTACVFSYMEIRKV